MAGKQQKLNLEQLDSWLGNADDSTIEQILAQFLCIRNKEVQDFLHISAIELEKSSSARTYLLANENKEIAGYFTLSIGFADISKSVCLSEDEKEKLKMSKCPDHRIPCFLIGQLGRNDSFSHDTLPGNIILEKALAVLVDVKDQIGGKFVIVECEDHLIEMYESENFGFRLFNTPNRKRTYNQLYRMLQFSDSNVIYIDA